MAKKRGKRITETPSEFDIQAADRLMLMMDMVRNGVTPEEYAEFYKMKPVIDEIADIFDVHAGKDDDFFGDNITAPFTPKVKPLDGASDKSIVLKIQMQGVTKPPMWREIVVPAEFNFSQLHYAIQAVTGLDNCHLWQFERSAYDHGFSIGIPKKEDFGFGIDDCTYNADETPISAFLAKKGDKLVYVYDFRVDWIFEISVLDIINRDGEVAYCRKIKSDLQASEYMRGNYGYTEFRDIIANADKLTAKRKKEIADNYWFDDFEEFLALADELRYDHDFVNEELAEVPDQWEDID